MSWRGKAMRYRAIQDIEGGGEPTKSMVRDRKKTTPIMMRASTVQKLMASTFRDRPGPN